MTESLIYILCIYNDQLYTDCTFLYDQVILHVRIMEVVMEEITAVVTLDLVVDVVKMVSCNSLLYVHI